MISPAPSARILVIDDDAALRETLADGLRSHGHDVTAAGADTAPKLVRDPAHDVLVTDLRMPEIDGIGLLTLSKQIVPDRPVIVMTAFGAVDTAVDSLRKGAFHYLLKPFKVAELDLVIGRGLEERALRREARSLKRALRQRFALDRLVAQSGAMQQVRELVERIADADVPTLLVGETGTGKGMFARALHAESARAAAAFVAVNCAALPETLLESELFGHVRGAFTGAHADRRGLFEQADGGVLFLDEVGDMAPALQAKLLDVLERRCVRALGSSRERPVDVRILAATHRDLRSRIGAGLFREDLLYRLEGVVVEIPPLRQRRDDIAPLVAQFIAEARIANPKATVQRFSSEAMTRLLEYAWPGNVRELENAVSRAVLLGRAAEATIGDLPPSLGLERLVSSAAEFGDEILPIRELQRRYAAWALERLGGRKNLACERLGIDAKTLNKWLAPEDPSGMADIGTTIVAGARRLLARWWLQISMLLAIGVVFAAAIWSATVERRAALTDFSHEHAALATMVSVDFEHRLHSMTTDRTSDTVLADGAILELLGGARRLEARGDLMVLVARPEQDGFLTTDGRLIPSARLRAALDSGVDATTIPRDEAVAFDLPRRMAVAGLARVAAGSHGHWGIVALASAERMRNREKQEEWRLGLTVLVVSALVAAFGGLAQRRQRRELELQRQVVVSSLQRDREALLAKADKMAALAALSTGIAHELGTPLGVIVGRVEQALDCVGNDERVTVPLGIVLEQVGRIQAIVRGCLALARGDSPQLVQSAPGSIAKHAIELVRHRFSSANVALTWDVDAELQQIACEPSLFEQALVNVLLNACQATPVGGAVRLHVSSLRDRVLFVVDDDGAGIAEDVAQRATEPFFSTKREDGGFGLGLTIAREIISHHAGTLTLARRDGGRGTRAVIAVRT